MTDFCRHPGCIHPLSPGNVSGVCRVHMHGPACRCATCRAPRKAGGKRRNPRYRIRTRAELEADGLLLPGITLMSPVLKGSP